MKLYEDIKDIEEAKECVGCGCCPFEDNKCPSFIIENVDKGVNFEVLDDGYIIDNYCMTCIENFYESEDYKI